MYHQGSTMNRIICTLLLVATTLAGCSQDQPPAASEPATGKTRAALEPAPGPKAEAGAATSRYDIYTEVELDADLSHLSDAQRQMLALLIDASDIMDVLFWVQTYGDKNALLNSIEDPAQRRFAEINYGPWDRLAADKPFVTGVGAKPLGANTYPADMSKEEFEDWDEPDKRNKYAMVERAADGSLKLVPYSEAFKPQLLLASQKLLQASVLAEDAGFARYLQLRAAALLSGEYYESDMQWMDMKTNPIDIVYGPIEDYEDQLYGYHSAFEALVLVKDMAWSKALSRFAAFLPELQRGLPVAEKYKREMPGTDSDLNAYDVVYTAGRANAAGKSIAINLPNDEKVQLAKGTRRLQLKNAMRAKFDKILVPIAHELMAPDQLQYITFDAFFNIGMFHEVAHGLGIKNTLTGKGYVREALKDTYLALEEGKADILGLYMIKRLAEKGEIPMAELRDHYVTFMAGIFRSVRFGASSAHGKASMIRFNFFQEAGAFSRDPETGLYSTNFDNMETAMADLSRLILELQGNGDYEGAVRILKQDGVVSPGLQADLARLQDANIPVDITYIQGKKVLGLE
jgi:hypothetical protein